MYWFNIGKLRIQNPEICILKWWLSFWFKHFPLYTFAVHYFSMFQLVFFVVSWKHSSPGYRKLKKSHQKIMIKWPWLQVWWTKLSVTLNLCILSVICCPWFGSQPFLCFFKISYLLSIDQKNVLFVRCLVWVVGHYPLCLFLSHMLSVGQYFFC